MHYLARYVYFICNDGVMMMIVMMMSVMIITRGLCEQSVLSCLRLIALKSRCYLVNV